MTRRVKYYFYKEVDGMKVYKELLGDKYTIEFKENGRTISILFYFDYNGDLIINNVYKNMTNYKNYRYIKKYAENETLIKAMMEFK